jgi:hypothetical protein
MDWNEDLEEDELRKTEMSGLKKAKQVHFEKIIQWKPIKSVRVLKPCKNYLNLVG